MRNRSVVLFGALPPPVGGVSIHLERFLNELEKSDWAGCLIDVKRRVATDVYGGNVSLWVALSLFFKAEIVHIHISNSIKVIVAFLSRVLGKKVIYTHHNNVIGNKYLFQLLIMVCNKVIFVNEKCVPSRLYRNDFRRKWEVIPAFIPPVKTDPLPRHVLDAISPYDTVLSTNAYKKSLIYGQEVYGIDLVLKLYTKLVSCDFEKSIVLIFFDPSGTHKSQVEAVLGSIDASKKAEVAFLYFSEPSLSFFELLKISHASIRATRTDGDSLSIRESLFLGVPVITSDVVDRPKGCVLFRSGCADDLFFKVLDLINNDVAVNPASQYFFSDVINLYENLRGGE
tara:strand:+ start:1058 stop:2080 length:1023 start_codon:yes stop_codon:yes gene_type:complete